MIQKIGLGIVFVSLLVFLEEWIWVYGTEINIPLIERILAQTMVIGVLILLISEAF